jgi:polyribonucleotide nucleotidyltransferase
MKKKYVAMLVALAMCLVAIVGYVIYSNWSEITSDITAAVRTLTKVKDAIRRMKPDTAKIVVQKPETILALAPSNPELTSQIADITRAANLAQRDADVVNTETAGVVENQAKTRRAEAVPLKAIVLNNAKQKNIEEQKRASQEYAEVLKKIEEEKVRAGVLLTAIQTEKQKIAKIDALDREISHAPLFPAVHLVRPVSKQDMNSIIADM